jgi:hypothetical protein
MTSFGRNLGHSPTFIIPLFAVGLLLFSTRWSRDWRYLAFYSSAVGVLTVFYDDLSGGIPFVLSVYLFSYSIVRLSAGHAPPSLLGLARDFAIIGSSFLIAAVFLIAIKLVLAILIAGDYGPAAVFRGQLGWRMSHADVPGGESYAVALLEVARRLWFARAVVFFGGEKVANWFFVLGAVAWLSATAMAFMQCRNTGIPTPLLRVAAAVAAAAVIPAWFMAFPSHAFIHAIFMTRIIGVVPALGIAVLAATLVARASDRDKAVGPRLCGPATRLDGATSPAAHGRQGHDVPLG